MIEIKNCSFLPFIRSNLQYKYIFAMILKEVYDSIFITVELQLK